MRKIIVSLNITLDGFIAGEELELDWHFRYWNAELARYATEQLSRADTILLGRITFEAMQDYWPAKAVDTYYPREDISFAYMMNNYNKIVFSKTVSASTWHNTRFVKSGLKKEVQRLRMQVGKPIMVYGSCSIVSALMKYNLVDEYLLWVHPILLGRGRSLFNGTEREELLLKESQAFRSGVVVLSYAVTAHHFNTKKDIYGEVYFER